MATRNKGEFDRSPAAPGGLGDSERRALEDIREGVQARASDEDVEKARARLGDTAGDGGGRIGAAADGRSTSQPEGEGDEEHTRRGSPSQDDERRRMSESLRNEQDRLTRR